MRDPAAAERPQARGQDGPAGDVNQSGAARRAGARQEVRRVLRLSKLTLNGFKSFADKTVFTFDEPVIGIVGPNGCGKSNVVDAVKWVLGERSAKSLRSKEMQDVIFAGSAARKPSGLASVVLTFDNPAYTSEELEALRADPGFGAADADEIERAIESGAAPPEPNEPTENEPTETPEPDEPAARRERGRPLNIDTDTVDVERRLYRDGTSQYLINGRKARLRDIRELFMDTGVGADAYSIIEQGKVDAMLLARPQERRVFFEEAAGSRSSRRGASRASASSSGWK